MKIKYLDKLQVSPLYDGITWEVLQPFRFELLYDIPTNNESYTIPKHFLTDFASIPKFLWWLIGSPATGNHRYPALIHDYFYRTKTTMSRKQADDLFYEVLLQDGVSKWKAYAMYKAVRIFGEEHWHV